MDAQYGSVPYPYNMDGSLMEYFRGLTYDHVNFIFSGSSNVQGYLRDPFFSKFIVVLIENSDSDVYIENHENYYPSVNANFYKEAEYDTYSYGDYGHSYETNNHLQGYQENRRHFANPSMTTTTNEQIVAVNCDRNDDVAHDNAAACPRRHPNSQDYQVVWQDPIDPDNMTYEELLELGEAVGTQSRGLSQEVISLLPVSRYKCGFFLGKKSRDNRCVICQMGYKRGDRQMTLPCKHIYHAGCGSKWLSINKACPICYTEVYVDAPETVKK